VAEFIAYFWIQNIGQRPFAQKMAGNNPHDVTTFMIHPQFLHPCNSKFHNIPLNDHKFHKAVKGEVVELFFLFKQQLLYYYGILYYKSKNGFDKIFRNVLCLVFSAKPSPHFFCFFTFVGRFLLFFSYFHLDFIINNVLFI